MPGTPLAQRIRQLAEGSRARHIDDAVLAAKNVFGALEGVAERDIISPWQCTTAFSVMTAQWLSSDDDEMDRAYVWHGEEAGTEESVPFLPNQVRAMAVWQGAIRACGFVDIDERPLKKQDPGSSALSPLDRVINAVNRDVELPLGLTHIWSNNLLGEAQHGVFVLQVEDDHIGLFIGRTLGGIDRVAILGLQPFAANWQREAADAPVAETGLHQDFLIEEDAVYLTSRADRASLEWWELLAPHQRTLLTGTLLQYSAGMAPDILTPHLKPHLAGVSLLPRPAAAKD